MKRHILFSSFLLVELLLVACCPTPADPDTAVTASIPISASTHTPMPSSVPIYTATSTPTPGPTSTPLPDLPVLGGTPVPLSSSPITAASADQVVQLARWGEGAFYNVAWSPDGSLLAVASSLGVHLYDIGSMEEVRFIETGGAMLIDFSPDGETVAIALGDTIRLWRVSDGAFLHALKGHMSFVGCLAFSPDGAFLASGANDNTLRLWQVSDGMLVRTLVEPMAWFGDQRYMTNVAFSPDGQSIAARSLHGIHLWRADDGILLRTLSADSARGLAFSPDGEVLAVGMMNGSIRLLNSANGTLIRDLKGHTRTALTVAFSPDGKTVASGAWDGTVRLWNSGEGTLLHVLEGHESDQIEKVAFSPDGTILASVSRFGHTVRLWGVADGTQLGTFEKDAVDATDVAFSPDGLTVALAVENTVQLRQAADGAVVRAMEGHTKTVNSVDFDPSGTLLASGSADGAVRLWRATDGTLVRALEGHAGPVEDVAFSPDGETLASAGGEDDHSVRLWRVADGTVLRVLKGHAAEVQEVAFSPDGILLASAGGEGDGTVRIWRVSDGDLLHELDGPSYGVSGLAFSPDGEILAVGGSGKLWAWRITDMAPLYTLEYVSVRSLAFSPDGTLLAVGAGGPIQLYNAVDGTSVGVLHGHASGVAGLAFSPDGTLLASVSWDFTVRLWGVIPQVFVVYATPTPVPTPTPCLPDASLVASDSVPDGTTFGPGEHFTKVWRMQSSGCAPWPSGTVWAFVSGDRMGAPDSVSVPETPVGETIDIAVEMVAPETVGTYQSFWQMQAPSGEWIGQQVYVQIVVSVVPTLGAPTPEEDASLTIRLTGSVTCDGELSMALRGPASYDLTWCPSDWVTCEGQSGAKIIPGTYEYTVTGCGGSTSGTAVLEVGEKVVGYMMTCICKPSASGMTLNCNLSQLIRITP